MPLAAFSYGTAYFVFLILNMPVLLLCSARLWRLFAGPANEGWVAWLLAGGLLPALAAVGFGQMGVLLLLGIVLFSICSPCPLLV